jgi:hypothetical protein
MEFRIGINLGDVVVAATTACRRTRFGRAHGSTAAGQTFADGMTDDLITELSKVSPVRDRASSSRIPTEPDC